MDVDQASKYITLTCMWPSSYKFSLQKIGTRIQAQFKKQMNSKMKLLKNKWISYNHRAISYNATYTPNPYLPTPTFDEVKSFQINNSFWNIGLLDHPNEPWAIDVETQKGITAYLTITNCDDELRRISREARQALNWAVNMAAKVENILEALLMGVYNFRKIVKWIYNLIEYFWPLHRCARDRCSNRNSAEFTGYLQSQKSTEVSYGIGDF
jgi:hypothetical protein